MKLHVAICILFLFLLSTVSNAQEIVPANGDNFNYTQIRFEVPQITHATSYSFHISKCDMRYENCNSVTSVKSKLRSIVIDNNIEFGTSYTWYYVASKGNKILYTSPKYAFTTLNSVLTDTHYQRINWVKKPHKKRKGIIFSDGLKIAFNMNGEAVYFMRYQPDHSIRDINLTPNGTLTFIDNKLGEVKETKLNGEMIWTGPMYELNNKESYHHEFEKLKNGNYLVAGKKRVSELDEKDILEKVVGTTLSETIVEFNQAGEEVWRFDLLPELKKQLRLEPETNNFNPSRLGHLNGLAVDENTQTVFASFKTFNAILKINKLNKEIQYIYGAKKLNFTDSLENAVTIIQQHNPSFLYDGNILVFNNGTTKTGSGIVILNNSNKLSIDNELINTIWFKDFLKADYQTNQMGSAQEICKNTVLIGMGTQNHFFEFNYKKKKINFQGYTFINQSKNSNVTDWKPLTSYRVFYYSSLHPYHFTIDTISHNQSYQIILSNTGSETDTYSVTQFNVNDTIYYKPIRLAPKQSKRLKILNNKNTILKFVSDKNKEAIKQIQL